MQSCKDTYKQTSNKPAKGKHETLKPKSYRAASRSRISKKNNGYTPDDTILNMYHSMGDNTFSTNEGTVVSRGNESFDSSFKKKAADSEDSTPQQSKFRKSAKTSRDWPVSHEQSGYPTTESSLTGDKSDDQPEGLKESCSFYNMLLNAKRKEISNLNHSQSIFVEFLKHLI